MCERPEPEVVGVDGDTWNVTGKGNAEPFLLENQRSRRVIVAVEGYISECVERVADLYWRAGFPAQGEAFLQQFLCSLEIVTLEL